MSASVNAPCPCGSSIKYKKCCGVYHRGRPAPPAKLMPARYCAYAIGNIAFVMDTTHPDGPHFRADRKAWKAELEEFCRTTRFLGLVVHGHQMPPNEVGDAFVSFRAHLVQGDAPVLRAERSRFRRDGTRWKYLDAQELPGP